MEASSEHLGKVYVETRNLRTRWVADFERAPRQINALLQQICDAVAANELGEEGSVDVPSLWDEVTRLRRLQEVAPAVIRRIEAAEQERQAAFNTAQRVESEQRAKSEYFALRSALIEQGKAGIIPPTQDLNRVEPLANAAKFPGEGRALVAAFDDLARRQTFNKSAEFRFTPEAPCDP
jgi:hypothetical protein